MENVSVWKALEYAKNHYPFDIDLVYSTVIRLRKKCVLLPEFGIDGSKRDESDWAYIDSAGKIDSGEYGHIYYFTDKQVLDVMEYLLGR